MHLALQLFFKHALLLGTSIHHLALDLLSSPLPLLHRSHHVIGSYEFQYTQWRVSHRQHLGSDCLGCASCCPSAHQATFADI
jgi:hypothetical protein